MNKRLIALSAVAALAVAACGDDDDGDTATEGTAAPAATTADTTAATEAAADTTTAATTAATEGTTAETSMGTTGDTASGGSMAPVTPGEDWPESLVFTLTPSQEAGGLIETAQPLADMLSERLGVDVEALVPTDYAGVIVALESGQAQVAGGLGPNQMVQAEEQAGATLILQAERFGALTYVTQWFTNDPATYCADEPTPGGEDEFLFCNGVGDAETAEEGPIGEDQLANVDGQTVAFVDQGSTSGYLVPALQLLNAGVDPQTGITPLFAGGHDAAVQAVYDGDAAVGVSFNDARDQLVEQVPDVGEQVVVFGWSGPIPNDGFAVAGDLPDDLKQAITDAFVDISASEEGTALLQELYEIDGLQPVNSADYDVIRELNTELADLLE
jgi:phosphonate transport system substrate-binding protein